MQNLIDEVARECLVIGLRRRLNRSNVIEVLADAMVEPGIPEHIRPHNGPEFRAKTKQVAVCNGRRESLYRTRLSWGDRLLSDVLLEATP